MLTQCVIFYVFRSRETRDSGEMMKCDKSHVDHQRSEKIREKHSPSTESKENKSHKLVHRHSLNDMRPSCEYLIINVHLMLIQTYSLYYWSIVYCAVCHDEADRCRRVSSVTDEIIRRADEHRWTEHEQKKCNVHQDTCWKTERLFSSATVRLILKPKLHHP